MKKILVLGGNRFFGRHLTEDLLGRGCEVTLLNRGQIDDGFGPRVTRLRADRQNREALAKAVEGRSWDVVIDQICYAAGEAEAACEIFRDKTPRYVITSSESVYEYGTDLRESEFDPAAFRFEEHALPNVNYQAAKRQTEAVFARSDAFATAIVRPSLVVGIDDYTGRLRWHVERTAKGLPMCFPEIRNESDFIRSDQAGRALAIVALSDHAGPVNLTAPGALSLARLVELCEAATGRRAVLESFVDAGPRPVLNWEKSESRSPYGGGATKTMNTDLLRSLGAKVEPSPEWMPELVTEIARGL